MIRMNVSLGDRGYPIYIAPDFSGLGKACTKAGLRGKMMIVTDDNVEKQYCDECTEIFAGSGFQVFRHVIRVGERSKNLETIAEIYRQLISLNLDRSSVLVALGGGVVGDITGFAAATFMRGIPFIQVPTSLLAQADSSIGGKTGVDFEGSKNMIGAFHQPRFVFINVNTLKTLPEREMRAGLAEVIKHGLIMDADFYEYIDSNMDKIFTYEANTLQYITKLNCSIKGKVVELDEREGGLRGILNFGHTIGHAVESASEFSMLHGEAISIGMAGAYRLAQKLGMADENVLGKVENTLKKAELPINAHGLDKEAIFQRMFHDKKLKDGKLNFVLPKGIGEVIQCTVDNTDLIKEVLNELIM